MIMACGCKLLPIKHGEHAGESALVVCESCSKAMQRQIDNLMAFGSSAVAIRNDRSPLIEHVNL